MKTAILAAAIGIPIVIASPQALGDGTRIPGYLDLSTGVFSPRLASPPPATAVPRTGVVTITITVAMDSAIPLEQTVTCNAGLSSFDSSFTNTAGAQSTVVKSSKTVGKCVLTIPYVWEVAAATTNMSVTASITSGTSFGIGSVGHTGSTTFTPFAVPNGNTALAVTLAI